MKRCRACGRSLKGARSQSYCPGGWKYNSPVEGSCVDLWGRNHMWQLASLEAHILAGSRTEATHRLYREGECAHAGLYGISCTRPRARDERWNGNNHTREVNHIEPRNGMGYGSGCFNHQANLEVLCRAHHGRVSGLQTQARNRVDEQRRVRVDVVVGRRMDLG